MSQDSYEYSPLLGQLVSALRRLPGVGGKSAQRMALHLLQRDRDGGRQIERSVAAALDGIRQCPRSRGVGRREPATSRVRRGTALLSRVAGAA